MSTAKHGAVPLTVIHGYLTIDRLAVLQTADGVPVDLALEAAESLLGSVVTELRGLLHDPGISSRIHLILHAAETAHALVCAVPSPDIAEEVPA